MLKSIIQNITVVFLCLLTLSACTPARLRDQAANQPAPLPSADSSQHVAQFLSSSSEGAVQHFAHSELGDEATVVAGRSYTSALGAECREAVAVRGGLRPMRFAACRDEREGVWRLAPQIFAGGAE